MINKRDLDLTVWSFQVLSFMDFLSELQRKPKSFKFRSIVTVNAVCYLLSPYECEDILQQTTMWLVRYKM